MEDWISGERVDIVSRGEYAFWQDVERRVKRKKMQKQSLSLL